MQYYAWEYIKETEKTVYLYTNCDVTNAVEHRKWDLMRDSKYQEFKNKLRPKNRKGGLEIP